MNKKWVSFAMATVACCGMAFFGCNEQPDGDSVSSSNESASETSSDSVIDSGENSNEVGVTRAEWDEMLKEDAFVNCTIKQTSIVYETENATTGQNQLAILRLVNGEVAVYIEVEGSVVVDRVFTGAEGEEMTAGYCDIAFALLNKYESFAYDAQEDAYEVTETVSVTVTANGTPCNVIMEEGKATISKEGRLTSFTCKMTEVIPDEEIVIYADITWEFSNYGTTVIE